MFFWTHTDLHGNGNCIETAHIGAKTSKILQNDIYTTFTPTRISFGNGSFFKDVEYVYRQEK